MSTADQPVPDSNSNPSQIIGLLGATSFVGASLLDKLKSTSLQVVAYTRRHIHGHPGNVAWRELESELPLSQKANTEVPIPHWICLAPIAVLPKYFNLLEAHGVRRLVVLSTTSLFTKMTSPDQGEQDLVRHISEAEERIQRWAEQRGVEWIILRPTLIYGRGQDRNIAEITRFIRRFGFFPVFGKACGLRQPIHVQDVAGACLITLQSCTLANRAYNISGAETLTYREMVARIFRLLGKRPMIVPIPLWMFRASVFLLRRFPRYSKWSSAMAERMNADMIFDHTEVRRDFQFKPRTFNLSVDDLPT
jgi:NAD dependent epimerase/dehydratase family enzyme